MDPFDWLLIPGIPALALWGVVAIRRYEAKVAQRRNELMESWGQEHGLAILDRPNLTPNVLQTVITGVASDKIAPFQRPGLLEHGFAYNFLEGQIEGRRVLVFDHRFIHRSRASDPIRTVVAVSVRPTAPDFTVRPRRFWDNVTARLGNQDLKTGEPDFDGMFHISTTDEAFMRRLLERPILHMMYQGETIAWHSANGFVISIAPTQSPPHQLSWMLENTMLLAEKVDNA